MVGTKGKRRGFGFFKATKDRSIDLVSEEDREENNVPDNLEEYLGKLMQQCDMSQVVRKIMVKQFKKSGLKERLEIIASLEQEIGAKAPSNQEPDSSTSDGEKVGKIVDQDDKNVGSNQPPPQQQKQQQNQEEQEQEQEQEQDQEDDMDTQGVDYEWAKMLARSHLTEGKCRALNAQYFALKRPEERMNMLLEFESYLRPMSDEGKKFMEMYDSMDPNEAKNLIHNTQKNAYAEGVPGMGLGRTGWFLFPSVTSAPIFIAALFATLLFRFLAMGTE